MAKKINNNSHLEAGSSGLITWSGPAIPCLGICKNENLDELIITFADKLCELTSPLDLSTLTLQCALDIFDKEEPTNRTIKNVLQLLLDNDCGIKDLIDGIQDQIDGISTPSLVLNLRCLLDNYKDQFGNALPYTTQSILQDLITELCSLKTIVSGISGNVSNLTAVVNNHLLNHPATPLPNVTNCISTNKALDVAINETASSICAYKTAIGSEGQKNIAIARQTSGINTIMSGVTGWITTPSTAMESLNNMWLYLTKIGVDVDNLSECCASDCDDIKIGFVTEFDGDSVILRFTSGAGTFIPTGFTDCGSTVTVSDTQGHVLTVNTPITLNYETNEIDLSSFTKGDTLSFNVSLKMCSGSITCEKCINKSVKYIDTGCCIITNSGTSDITIIYQTPINNLS